MHAHTPYLVVLGQDAVHIGHILAGDLLDDQGVVLRVEEQALSRGFCTPHWGTPRQ